MLNKNLFCNGMYLDVEKRLIKCCVCSVVLYECVRWSSFLGKREKDRIEAFAKWTWRIEWIERANNEEFVSRIKENITRVYTFTKRKGDGVGHITRRNGY